MAKSFLKRVQSAPRIKAVKRKITKQKSGLKTLSRSYKSLIKSESRRIAKTIKKPKKKKRR